MSRLRDQHAQNAGLQIVVVDDDERHAGAKAPRDVAEIVSRAGLDRLCIRRAKIPRNWRDNLYRLIWLLKCQWYRFRVPRGTTLFVQFPGIVFASLLGIYLLRLFSRRAARVVTLIHDVEVLRGQQSSPVENGVDAFLRTAIGLSDKLIVHNARMRQWFEEHSVPSGKLVELGLFDYLADDEPMPVRTPELRHGPVIIAGNLETKTKSVYLASLGEIADVNWRLYGPNFDAARLSAANVEYCGCFSPEELPARLDGSYGLVWDGPSVETCTGDWGGYLRFNNPHKLSLYLAAGLPVIVWTQSATADFVRRSRIGLAVDSLRDVAARLANVSAADYADWCANARRLGVDLRQGRMLSHALAACALTDDFTKTRQSEGNEDHATP